MNRDALRIVIVLGSGRSGTSMTMNMLGRMGMSMSDNLIPAGPHNTLGFFEDREIVSLHRKWLTELNADVLPPFDIDWSSPWAAVARAELRSLLEGIRASHQGIYGIKDPRLASFLPLWRDVMAELGIDWLPLLTVREPGAVLSSMANAGINRSQGGLLWLTRTLDALHYTEGRCFVLNYEDCLTHTDAVFAELLAYTGLGVGDDSVALAEAGSAAVLADMNHQHDAEPVAFSDMIDELYKVLRPLRGVGFDAAALFALTQRLRAELTRATQLLDGFRSDFVPIGRYRIATDRVTVLERRLAEREATVTSLRDKVAELRGTVTELRGKVTELRGKVTDLLQQARDQAAALQAEQLKHKRPGA